MIARDSRSTGDTNSRDRKGRYCRSATAHCAVAASRIVRDSTFDFLLELSKLAGGLFKSFYSGVQSLAEVLPVKTVAMKIEAVIVGAN